MLAFKAPFSFDGRIGRKDFILVVVTAYITYVVNAGLLVLLFKGLHIPENTFSYTLLILVAIPNLWYLLAQGAKRLHDLNLSGWVQIVYPIALAIMIFKEGDAQDNQYGPALRSVKSKYPMNEDEFSLPSTENSKNYKRESIPVICQICKSPNPSKKSICDWCGGEII